MSDAINRFMEQQRERDRLLNEAVGGKGYLGTLDTGSAITKAMRDLVEGPSIAKMMGGDSLFALQNTATGIMDSGVLDQARRIAMELDRNLVRGQLGEFGIDAGLVERGARDFYRQFRHPAHDDTIALASRVAATSLMDVSRVRDALTGVSSDWARISDEFGSATSVARLHEYGLAVARADPFSEQVSTLLRGGLGDWRGFDIPDVASILDIQSRRSIYREVGMEPGLADFTPDAFDEITASAGLEREPSAESSDEEDRAASAFRTIRRLEQQVRDFIERRLRSVFGDNWEKSQIPGDMRKNWVAKREDEIRRQRPPRHRLIDYADFSDYWMIFERKDNWEQAFSGVFVRKTDIQESLLRIAPVRIVTSHAAIVTQDDEVLLGIEARRILNAIQRSA